MTLFGIECLLAQSSAPPQVIVADGSGLCSAALQAKCAAAGCVYLPSEQRESFARTYNRGMAAASGDYRVWMASDIFVARDWDARLIAQMKRTGAWMAAPLLSVSDYPAQMRQWVFSLRTFRPSGMTFNLNMVTRQCLERVGLMDEEFSGNFTDLDYLVRIRRAGGEAIIADAGEILHVGRATLSVASSTALAADQQRFNAKYPELASPRRGWYQDLRNPIFSRSRRFRCLMRLARRLPSDTAANLLTRAALRIEPWLHRI